MFDSRKNIVTIKKREINKALKQYCNGILNEIDWKQFYSLYDPNLAYEYFTYIQQYFSSIYDHTFPFKQVRKKLKTALKPWVTKTLQKSPK